jgi:hypothetical protein
MIELISNVLGGNPFKAISSLFSESPQKNIREAVVGLLDGKDRQKNMAKIHEQLARPGGDRGKLEEVNALLAAEGEGDVSAETLEKILTIVKPDESGKRVTYTGSPMSFGETSKHSGVNGFVNF